MARLPGKHIGDRHMAIKNERKETLEYSIYDTL